MVVMKDLMKKIRSKGRMDAKENDCGSRSCWRRIVRKHGSTQDGKIPCRNGTNGWSTSRRKMLESAAGSA